MKRDRIETLLYAMALLVMVGLGVASILLLAGCATAHTPSEATTHRATRIVELNTTLVPDDPMAMTFIRVYWMGDCAVPPVKPPLLAERCVDGYAVTKRSHTEIYVRWTGQFCDSAFAHEIRHAFRAAVGLSGHDDEYRIDDEARANDALCEAGL